MVKKKLVLYGFLLAVFIVIGFLIYNKEKVKYSRAVDVFYIYQDRYDLPVSWHFCCARYELPKSLADIDDIYMEDFIDPFSRKGELLQYIPLYNRETLTRESFMFISAGVDGLINTLYSENDTIFQDSFDEVFDFYEIATNTKPPKFNIWTRYFGEKDFLLLYKNQVKVYRGSVADTIHRFDVFVDDQINSRSWINRTYFFEIDSQKITEFTSCGFAMNESDYTIKFKLFDCNQIMTYLNENRFSMIGILSYVDHNTREIGFELCMDPK